jgi:hypothetical protein
MTKRTTFAIASSKDFCVESSVHFSMSSPSNLILSAMWPVGAAAGTGVGATMGAAVVAVGAVVGKVGAAVGPLVGALVGAAVGLQLAVNVESMIQDEPSQYFQVPSALLRSDGVLSFE